MFGDKKIIESMNDQSGFPITNKKEYYFLFKFLPVCLDSLVEAYFLVF